MGNEARCRVRFGRKSAEGKALLESEELIIRGELRLKIPYREITRISAKDGALSVTFAEGTAVLELGDQAEKWLEKIKNPRSRLVKLGVKRGQKIALVGIAEAAFVAELKGRVEGVTVGKAGTEKDLLFLGVAKRKDLARIGALKESLRSNGALWVIREKGSAEVTEAGVREAGLAAGLVDVKVVKFSETHTAEKFVIPLAKR